MTRQEFEREVDHYERERTAFEAAHFQWRYSKEQSEMARTRVCQALTGIFLCLFILSFFHHWKRAHLAGLVAVTCWSQAILNYAKRLDAWWDRKRHGRFTRNHPEPDFDRERPAWLGDDTGPEEDFGYACPRYSSSPRMVLGVEETAGLDEVKRAYRNRIKKCHPDKFTHLGGDVRQVAEEHAKALNGAYASILAEGRNR